jgi:lauroyl/myristoyl acyltransferase
MYFLLAGSRRRATISNLRHILGPQGWWRERREALRVFVEFAHCFAERHEAYGPRPGSFELIPPEEDLLAAALARGRGAVVVTGHFGNPDIAAIGLSRYERPVSLVMARENNVTVEEFGRTLRAPRGLRVVYASGNPLRSLDLLRALRNNEIVAMHFDGHPQAPGVSTIDFFGRPAHFHPGPFLLARAAHAPVIPLFVVRAGRRRYAILLHGSYDPGTPEDAVSCLRQVVVDFEGLLRRYPHQWFQFSPYWTAPSQQEHPRALRRAERLDGAGGQTQTWSSGQA